MMGVIQEKYTLADVICQHKIDGSIIPLKIRITDEDGEYQVYNIKSYKDVSNRTAYTMPNGTSVTPANHLWKFECKISVFNTLKRIQLFYNAKIKKEKKSILLENTFLPFGVEMLFSWFIIVLFTMYLHLQTEISRRLFLYRNVYSDR